MAEVIDRFTTRVGNDYQHTPLSNFSISRTRIQEVEYETLEHWYQCMKTLDAAAREEIRTAPTAGLAKKLGRRCPLRPNWEEIKIPVMRFGLRHKFVPSNSEGRYLINTGNALLIEGNDWGDKFWGCVRGIGENWLGHLLMARRAEIRYLEVTGGGGIAIVRNGG